MADSDRNGDGINVGETAGHNGPVPRSRYISYGSIRPAQVLLEGKGDPGPPHVNPLLAARAKKRPTPSTSPSPENTGASGKDRAQASASKDAAATGSDESLSLRTIAAVTATTAPSSSAL